MAGMTSDMCRCGGVTCGAGNSASRPAFDGAGGGMCGKRGGTCLPNRYLTPSPSPRRFYGFARSVVAGAVCLEKRKNALDAIGNLMA